MPLGESPEKYSVLITCPNAQVWWPCVSDDFQHPQRAEMAALPKELQLDLLTEFHLLPEDLDHLDAGALFGKVQRSGHTLYR